MSNPREDLQSLIVSSREARAKRLRLAAKLRQNPADRETLALLLHSIDGQGTRLPKQGKRKGRAA